MGRSFELRSCTDFGARYYGSALGRFTSVDPESASASLFDPQRWNAYSYAVNNPYKFVDPDGENPLLISGGVGLVIGAAGGALFDVGNQLIQNGGHFDQINGQEVLGATIGGAVSGGLAGLTLGLIPAPATLTAGYLATSAVVNGGSNVVGGIVRREIDPTASNTPTTDFVAGAVGGAVGTKVAYVRYPLPNVKKELEAIAFSIGALYVRKKSPLSTAGHPANPPETSSPVQLPEQPLLISSVICGLI